ncbi:hypothetical protein [Metabacillus sediminilitoris]|uniref:hypothetical protein n=1 Tax=Metabacillus sediminilitoris TaxID=2567941 RepID=UPI001D0D873B|nr:hypothetical protein [Metabacillus sediminilitoris]
MSKQVLILSEAIGNGHTKAGEALMEGISHLAPSIQTQILELGQVLRPLSTKLIVNYRSFPFIMEKNLSL